MQSIPIPEINQRSTALLIVDVQKGFINEHTKYLPALVEQLQQHYSFVIASRFYNKEGSAFRKQMGWTRFSKSNPETELAFAAGEETVMIDKNTYGCVTSKFQALLDQRKISTVHIAGCDTNMCVSQCAIEIFETHRYRPVVLASYCASHSGQDYHSYGLKLLEKAIGKEQIWMLP